MSSTSPIVSVLMPCYNAADTLDEALESIERQTLVDFEVVAVDDGSSDGTSTILNRWAARDARFRVITIQHQGILEALNAGLHACRAPYVARMDGDDRSHPERLARQVAYLDEHPEIGVVSCLVKGFPDPEVRQGFRVYMRWLNTLVWDADIRREIFIESPIPHPSAAFRRDLILQAGGYQEHGWAEDYDLWLRLYLMRAGFAKVPEVLLEWREHPERLTRVDGRYSVENFLRAKAYYLARGPLANSKAVIIWGAGMMGRRLSKQLERQQVPLTAYIDVNPRKIGRTLRGRPVFAPEELPRLLEETSDTLVVAAVGARGARELIRQRLQAFGLCEGKDWWSAA